MLKNGEWLEDEQQQGNEQRALDRRKMDDAERLEQQGELAGQRSVLDSLRSEIESRASHLEEEARALAELAASLSQREETLRALASDQERRNGELDRRQQEIEEAEAKFTQEEGAEEPAQELSTEAESRDDWQSRDEEAPTAETEDESSIEEPAAEEISFSKVSSEAPLSTASLLAKYGLNLEDDEDPSPAAPSRAASSASAPALRNVEPERLVTKPAEAPAAAAAHADDDDDIGVYMAKLMQRRGGQGSWSPPETPNTKPVEAPKPVVSATPPAPERPKEPMRPMSPRPMPEMLASLSAMRELANMSARTQINAHVRKEFGDATLRALAILCIGLVAVAIFSWRHLAGDWWAFNATCAAVLGGVIMAVRYVDLMRRLKRKLIPSSVATSEE